MDGNDRTAAIDMVEEGVTAFLGVLVRSRVFSVPGSAPEP